MLGAVFCNDGALCDDVALCVMAGTECLMAGTMVQELRPGHWNVCRLEPPGRYAHAGLPFPLRGPLLAREAADGYTVPKAPAGYVFINVIYIIV